MQAILSQKLKKLAKSLSKPLYIVGGFTRDFLAGLTSAHQDIDLCSPVSLDEFLSVSQDCGFTPLAVYKNTGTVKLTSGDGEDYEFTCFRSDKYIRGEHTPCEIFFTQDISLDAKRRDFTVNAIYYDIAADKFEDPLGGIDDLKAKRLKTVDNPKKVFGEDGLRLLRLARQAGQTGFTPTKECIDGAKENSALILDIVPERIYAELCACLLADQKYGNRDGHYEALKILEETEVLFRLFPALLAGKGFAQRPDFHDHDVLEHSLRAVRYAHPSVRLAALFHDIAKPLCSLRDGNSHEHPNDGEQITMSALNGLKAPKKVVEETAALVKWHMYDFDGKTKENKLRRFFVEHAPLLEKLLLIKQADYSACKDDLSPCPTSVKWKAVFSKMQAENAPLFVKDLAVKGNELAEWGIPKKEISKYLKKLLLYAVNSPQDNEKKRLQKICLAFYKEDLKKELSQRDD